MRRHSLVRSLHPGSRGWALGRLGWVATLALCACGGEPDEARLQPVAQTATAPPPAAAPATAALKITTPEQFFGHQIGADYVLPNYTKFTEFVKKLDAESDLSPRRDGRLDAGPRRQSRANGYGGGE